MQRSSYHRHQHRSGKAALTGLILAAILLGTTGLDCDDEASATFRQEATGAIGSGVKTIMNGVLDGLITAIQEAGDGSSSSSSSDTSSSSSSSDTSSSSSSTS